MQAYCICEGWQSCRLTQTVLAAFYATTCLSTCTSPQPYGGEGAPGCPPGLHGKHLAKPLGGGLLQIVGEARGTTTPANRVIVNVKGTNLPQCIYRLEAAVPPHSALGETPAGPCLAALLKDGLLQVY